MALKGQNELNRTLSDVNLFGRLGCIENVWRYRAYLAPLSRVYLMRLPLARKAKRHSQT